MAGWQEHIEKEVQARREFGEQMGRFGEKAVQAQLLASPKVKPKAEKPKVEKPKVGKTEVLGTLGETLVESWSGDGTEKSEHWVEDEYVWSDEEEEEGDEEEQWDENAGSSPGCPFEPGSLAATRWEKQQKPKRPRGERGGRKNKKRKQKQSEDGWSGGGWSQHSSWSQHESSHKKKKGSKPVWGAYALEDKHSSSSSTDYQVKGRNSLGGTGRSSSSNSGSNTTFGEDTGMSAFTGMMKKAWKTERWVPEDHGKSSN